MHLVPLLRALLSPSRGLLSALGRASSPLTTLLSRLWQSLTSCNPSLNSRRPGMGPGRSSTGLMRVFFPPLPQRASVRQLPELSYVEAYAVMQLLTTPQLNTSPCTAERRIRLAATHSQILNACNESQTSANALSTLSALRADRHALPSAFGTGSIGGDPAAGSQSPTPILTSTPVLSDTGNKLSSLQGATEKHFQQLQPVSGCLPKHGGSVDHRPSDPSRIDHFARKPQASGHLRTPHLRRILA